MSIPLIGILLIFVIVLIFVFSKNKNDINKMYDGDVLVLFNDCYFIEPHVLVGILESLQVGEKNEIDMEVFVKVNRERESKISIDKYFSMYEYKCVVVESLDLNDDSVKFKLKFLKVDK